MPVRDACVAMTHARTSMHNDQDQKSHDDGQPRDEDGLEEDRLEKRTQRDQEERSRQALSNQGSQDRKPASRNADRAKGQSPG